MKDMMQFMMMMITTGIGISGIRTMQMAWMMR